MNIIVSVGVQFMLKDKSMDTPTMLPRISHDYPMDVTVSPELEGFCDEYSKSIADPSYMPQYDIGTALIKMITPRVKKAYPELWRKETDANGEVHQFKPNNETILESAMSIDIDDKIDELLEDRRDEVLKRLNVVFPEETATHYVAGVFLTNLGWKKA